MKALFHHFLERTDTDFLMRETEELWLKEFPQTFQAYHEAAFYVRDLLERSGIPNVKLHEFPADGKSAFLDARMPLAWDATIGRLTLLSGSKKVVADYAEHPFSLVKGSVLAGGRREVKIITADQLLGGADAKDALVLLYPGDKPDNRFIRHILDLGALGFIADAVSGFLEHPDSRGWFNAATEDGEWHVTAAHRPFLGFSITPRTGQFLRTELRTHELTALAECDGRLYEGVHHAVTALIPGRQAKEVWAYAHLYEPMTDDDSAGVIAAIETAKQILKEGTPEYSVRLVFAMEYYGYCAYIDSLGGNLRSSVIGGVNYDAVACSKGATLRCFRCPSGTSFCGNYLVDELNEALQGDPDGFAFADKGPAYHDDMAYSVPSIGLPNVWSPAEHGLDHHTSRQDMKIVDPATFARGTAYNTALVTSLANPEKKHFREAFPCAEKRLRAIREKIAAEPFGSDLERFRCLSSVERAHLADFQRLLPNADEAEKFEDFDKLSTSLEAGLSAEDPDAGSKWRTYASKIRMQYTGTGFPFSTLKLGHYEELPGGSIYGHIAFINAALHREMSLAQAIRQAEYEAGQPLPEHQIRTHINALNKLADAGYFRVVQRPELTQAEIVGQLRKLGVKRGDLLLVHSAVAGCGYIKGGAKTVIVALREAVGPEGTLLFPAFTRPYVNLGGPCREWDFRPYDPQDPAQIWTGTLPKTVLKKYPDVRRSRHLSHSWCGFGPLAEECLVRHDPADPPCSLNSPPGIAMEHGAKILHFGSTPASTTFLHFVETVCNVPFLGDAVCAEKTNLGTRLHVIRQH